MCNYKMHSLLISTGMQSGNLFDCSHSLRGKAHTVATLILMSNEDSSPRIRISCNTNHPRFINIQSTGHHTHSYIQSSTSHGSGETSDDWEEEFCNFLKVKRFVTTYVIAVASNSSPRAPVATPMKLYRHPFLDSFP